MPVPNVKFLVALGAFQVGYDALQVADQKRSCDEVKRAEDMWTTATIFAPSGAQAGPQEREDVTQMMTATQQYLSAIAQRKNAYCKDK